MFSYIFKKRNGKEGVSQIYYDVSITLVLLHFLLQRFYHVSSRQISQENCLFAPQKPSCQAPWTNCLVYLSDAVVKKVVSGNQYSHSNLFLNQRNILLLPSQNSTLVSFLLEKRPREVSKVSICSVLIGSRVKLDHF